ncbi:MAG: hypothetical protein EBU07_15905 [Betaproteobacteria bacterium]|jgi:hypothetical protein|nr:hypothetical protein [Betaproteobacteria bacterium]NBS47580.1 hypothetical protein [Betaproteobacteria bacterium]
MEQTPETDNPFMLMIDPQQVLRTMTRSSSLGALQHRTCRPLDRPVLRAISVDLVSFDAEIDRGFIEVQPDEDAPQGTH